MNIKADTTRLRTVALLAGLVSLVAACAFPFAPVTRPEVTYAWPSSPAPTAAAIPMLPYQPVSTVTAIGCDAARAVPPGTVLFSTTPPTPDPLAEPLDGLRVTTGPGGSLGIEVGGRSLTPLTPPSGPCTVSVSSTIPQTTVALATPGSPPRTVATVPGDARPAVAGAFTAAPTSAGLSFSAVGDTRFQTSATPLKIAIGAVAVLAFAVALGALVVGERRRRRADPTVPRRDAATGPEAVGSETGGPETGGPETGGPETGGPETAAPEAGGSGAGVRPRSRLADVGVVATLLIWQVIGPLSIDDGYIAGIVRSRFQNGQVGTVFRWLNSPETPFGWFYDVLALVARADPAPFWLRLPATLLAVAGWFLLTRGILPRLALPGGSRALLLAGLVYLAWWLPFDLGVRPEPWVLVGASAVFVLVERALARGTTVGLVVGLAVAGVTLAVTPTGVMAFAPLLAAVPALTRTLGDRSRAGLLALAVLGASALGLTAVLAFADQSWASVLDSIGIRTLIGGDHPWTDEYVRYASLLKTGDEEGNLGRRAPTLLLALAFAALAHARRGTRPGGTRGRVVAVTVLSLVALVFTPTKWTHHFGVFAVLGTAVTLLALDAWMRGPAGADARDEAREPRRAAVAIAAVAATAGLTLAGYNEWHWIDNYAVTWSTLAPQLAGIPFSDAALVLGVLLALAVAVLAARRSRRAGHGADPGTARTDRRLVALAPALALAVVALVVAVEVLGFARIAAQRRDSYTATSDSLASLSGRSCGAADDLRVETDPRAGLLPALGAGPAPATVPDGPTAAGVTLPAWNGPGVTTGWFGLPGPGNTPDPAHVTPVAVSLTGPALHGGVVAELARRTPTGLEPGPRVPLDEASSQYSESASTEAPRSRDLRLDPAVTRPWDQIRLVSTAAAPVAQGFSAPRIARLAGWDTVLPAGTPAALDWPGAFLFPCTPFPPLRDGLAPAPGWRVSIDTQGENRAGYISYSPAAGGPWATSRTLVRQVRYPVYLPGLPLTDIASLERWVPVAPLTAPAVTRSTVTEWGWSTPGPLSIGQS